MARRKMTDNVTTQHAKGTGAAYIYGLLRQDILDLSLAPGSDLDEAGLVERFGMSRTPVREAIIRLAADGLVILLPNRGAMVTNVDLMAFPRYVEALDLAQRAVTRFAALRRSRDELQSIVTARDAFEAATRGKDPLVMTARNRDYHVAIADACHNAHISELYCRLLDEGMRMLRIPFAFDPVGSNGVEKHVAKIVKEHRAITAAIKAQNAERAESLAHAHTELFQSRFLQYLNQNLSDDIDISWPKEASVR